MPGRDEVAAADEGLPGTVLGAGRAGARVIMIDG
jgi:hypothetical protein